MDRRTSLSMIAAGLAAAGTSAAASPETSFGTPEGTKVRADLPNFTAGTTVTRVVSRLD